MLHALKKELQKLGNPERAKILSGFFKTGKGEYGEGGVFLGITVPQQRKIAKKYAGLPLKDVQELLSSRMHEFRLTALLILVIKYSKEDDKGKKEIVRFYLKNTAKINNWDLVDLSADKILGSYLLNKDKSVLFRLAKSENLWERRIAMISTSSFIKNSEFEDSLRIAEMLLTDRHDLIHKAVGWMLREIGKRDLAAEERFLKLHCSQMPRTMLRYAVERLDEDKKKVYMG